MVEITKRETKDKIVGIAFTSTDYESIREIADKLEMKVSSYIREYLKQTLLKKNRK